MGPLVLVACLVCSRGLLLPGLCMVFGSFSLGSFAGAVQCAPCERLLLLRRPGFRRAWAHCPPGRSLVFSFSWPRGARPGCSDATAPRDQGPSPRDSVLLAWIFWQFAQMPAIERFPMMATIDITKLSAKILDYENAEAEIC